MNILENFNELVDCIDDKNYIKECCNNDLLNYEKYKRRLQNYKNRLTNFRNDEKELMKLYNKLLCLLYKHNESCVDNCGIVIKYFKIISSNDEINPKIFGKLIKLIIQKIYLEKLLSIFLPDSLVYFSKEDVNIYLQKITEFSILLGSIISEFNESISLLDDKGENLFGFNSTSDYKELWTILKMDSMKLLVKLTM